MVQNYVEMGMARFTGEGAAVKRSYKPPIESFEKALIEMNFHKTKTTPMTTHYKSDRDTRLRT